MSILITGASSGIGFCLAEEFIKKNQEVIGVSRRKTLDEAAYTHYSVDLKRNESSKFKEIAKNHVDLETIVLNAGYGVFKELEQFSDSEIVEMMNVNLVNQIILLKYLLPVLKKNGKGKIIIIGSEAGLNGAKKSTIYSATKFALQGFAESLRAECAKSNILVTIINPGMVKTNFHDELSFAPGEKPENHINTAQITEIVNLILSLDYNVNIDEINLSPRSKVVKFK
jgi:3-hydroxy acid dehydrogenase/malonic semialdehyde reductase